MLRGKTYQLEGVIIRRPSMISTNVSKALCLFDVVPLAGVFVTI